MISFRRILFIISILCIYSLSSFAQYPGSKYYPIVEGNTATFLLKADKAWKVKIYGDFLPGVNEYNLGGSAEMTQNEDGLWEYKAENLSPDFYFYYYEVDGVRVMDPNNLKVACNYSEFYNTFMVEGKESENLQIAPDKKGTVETLWYDSKQYETPGVGAQRRLNVYLPYGYSEKKKYPVFYMLPGGGDDEDTWVDMGRLPYIMDNMIAKGECEPMIVVMVNSMPNQLAGPHIMNPLSSRKSHFEMMGTPEGASGGEFANDFVNNIIPLVEKNFSVKTGKDDRAISGVSMGGMYLLYIIEHNPELFGNIVVMGSGFMSPDKDAIDKSLAPIKKAGYKLFWIGAGSKDMALSSAKNCMEGLDRNGMKYTYYDSEDGHNWRSWRRDLQTVLRVLFK